MPLNDELSVLNLDSSNRDIKDKLTRSLIVKREETGDYATRNYDEGQKFLWKDRKIYVVLPDNGIQTGDAITPNGNVMLVNDDILEQIRISQNITIMPNTVTSLSAFKTYIDNLATVFNGYSGIINGYIKEESSVNLGLPLTGYYYTCYIRGELRFVRVYNALGTSIYTLNKIDNWSSSWTKLIPNTLDNLIVTKTYTALYSLDPLYSKTLSANDFGISPINGYSIFGIKDYSSGAINCIFSYITPDGSNVACLRNVSSSGSTTSATASITISYIKSNFFGGSIS